MKKMKLIPILGVIALLSACNGGTSVSVKAPSFNSNGDEVTYAVFMSKLEALETTSELYKEATLGDRAMDYSYSTSQIVSVKRDNKEITHTEQKNSAKQVCKADYDSKVAKSETTSKTVITSKSAEGSGSMQSTSKANENYQFGKVEGTEYFLQVNNTTKSYEIYTGSNDALATFDGFVRSFALEIVDDYFEDYLPSQDELTSEFKFYIYKDTRFTYSYKREVVDNTSETANYITTYNVKAQLESADGKQSVKLSYETIEERTYKKSTYSYAAGDVYKSETKRYADASFLAKKVDLKAIDTANYAYIGGSYN